MRLTEVSYGGAKAIDGYGPDFWRVGGEVLRGSVLVTADGAQLWGGYDDRQALIALSGTVDVLFIGTGKVIAHLPADFCKALEDAGLAVEAMDSPAAARTYNVLLSEGRRIAAALVVTGP